MSARRTRHSSRSGLRNAREDDRHTPPPDLGGARNTDINRTSKDVSTFSQTSDTPCMRADRQSVLRSEKQHRQHFIHATEPATVDLYNVYCTLSDELLEQDPALTHLPGGHPDRPYRLANSAVAADVAGVVGLLHEPGVRECERVDPVDRLICLPNLISIDMRCRSVPMISRAIETRRTSSSRFAPTSSLICEKPSSIAARHKRRKLIIGIPKPTCRGRVAGVTVFLDS